MRIIEWFWRFLPDRCREKGCLRLGVRGNENVIDGRPVCDYCHARQRRIERLAPIVVNMR